MANTLTNVMPKILAQGLLALREVAIMPRLVNADYGGEAAMKGNTIDVPVAAGTITATNVTSAPTWSSATDSSPNLVQISLDNWKQANFWLSDKEMTEIDAGRHFLPMNASDAIKALANAVDNDIHAEYTGVYGFVGTAGSTPFASTVTDAVNVRKTLNNQLAPMDDQRRLVLDPDAMANALQVSAFSDLEKTGDRAVKIQGEMGRKFGLDFFETQNIATHTAGTAADITVASTTAAGTSTIGLSASVGGTLVLGDVFTIAGDSQTYAVTAQATVGSNTAVSIRPALQTAATSGAVVTKKATHVANLGFHRNAFAYASRPLMGEPLGSRIVSATDPVSGISLRLEVARQRKQTVWEYDVLWGAKLVRPEFAVRLAG